MNTEYRLNQIIKFTKVPVWSYLKENETYKVESVRTDGVMFKNTKTNGGTFENLNDLKNFFIKI